MKLLILFTLFLKLVKLHNFLFCIISIFVAATERDKYMSSLQLCYGCSYVSRSQYEDVLQLYKSGDILSKYPCRFKFKGEKAIDTGGVGRDLYSAFYDEVYRNFFEGSSFVILLFILELTWIMLLLLVP